MGVGGGVLVARLSFVVVRRGRPGAVVFVRVSYRVGWCGVAFVHRRLARGFHGVMVRAADVARGPDGRSGERPSSPQPTSSR